MNSSDGIIDSLLARDLLVRIMMKDPEAMMKVYDACWPAVFGVAFYLSGDRALAEDVAQEIFMQLWRTPEAFDPERGNITAWLVVSARNRTIDTFRKRHNEQSTAEMVLIDQRPFTQDSLLDSEKVRSLLTKLSLEQQIVFQLAFFDHLTYQQIADRINEPLGTVKSRIRSSLQSMRRVLNVKRNLQPNANSAASPGGEELIA